jgi:hypothetical protein
MGVSYSDMAVLLVVSHPECACGDYP